MAISFVGFSSNKVASGTSIGVVAPTGLAAGNLLIAMVNVKGATENINTPTGWTLINGSVINQSKTTVACFYKLAVAGDVGATLTFTYSASAIATAVVVAYSGVDQNSPLPSVGSSNGTTNTSGTWTNGGISISNANDQIVSIIGIEELSSVTYTVPTGYTKRVSYGYNTSNYESILVADKMVTAAGASGTTTWDASASSAVNYAQFDLELQQAVVDATVTPTAIASVESFGNSSIGLISLRSTPTTGTDYVSRGTVTANLPSGVVAGDLLIAVLNATSGSTDPSGWTPIATSAVLGPGGTYVHAYYKVATASEPASYTFNDGSGGYGQVIIAAYANTNQSIDASTVVNLSNGGQNVANLVPGTVTTSLNNELVLVLGGTYSEAGTLSSSYWQFDSHLAYTGNTDIFIAEGQQSAAGTSSSTAITHSSVNVGNAGLITVALGPAGQVGPSDQSLSPTAIVTAESFGSTSVTSSGAPDQSITATAIASSEVFGTASLSGGGANPVLLRSSSGSTVNGNGPVSVPAPGGVAAGDVLLAIVNQYATSITSITPPSGWTAVDTMQTFSTNNSAVQAFYKVATANEPASYTFTGNGTNLFEVAAIVLAYENADNTTPINAYAYNSGQATSATAASISTTVNNCLIVTLLGVDSSTNINSFTSASGWAVESSTTVSNAQAVVVAETQATSGSAGGENIAWDSTLHNWGGWTLSLAPVPTSSNQSLSPTAIASVEAFGTITVTAAYSVNASGNNIASVEAFGTASIDPEAYITGPPIASAEAFGSDTVIYDQFVSATAIASSELFGSDSLSTAYSISATNIASSESFGTDSVTTQSSLSPSSIATLEGLGTDSVTTANSITASAIPSAEAFGIVVLGAAIVPSSIASAERFGSDTLTTTASVTVSSIPSAEAFGATTMGTVGSIAPQPITSAESFGTDTVVAGPVTVAENSIPSAESFGTASITTAATISVSSIPSSEAFGTDRLDRNVTVASIPSSESMGSDSLTVVTVISPSAISSGEAFGTTQITTGGSIAVYTIPSSESFGSAVIVYDQKITTASIGSAESFGSDTVVAGAVTVSPPGVPLDSNVWAPSVTLVDIIGPTSIASSEHFGLSVIDVSIAVTTISSSESVPAPDVLLNNIFVDAISSAESFGTAIIGFDTRLQSNERYLIVASDRSRIVETSDRTRIVEASDRSRIVEADERTTVIEATVRNRVITG